MAIGMRIRLERMTLAVVKRPWLVSAVTVCVCASFGARAVAALVEARYLGPAPTAPTVARAAGKPAPVRVAPDGRILVERDLFCSACAPTVASGESIDFVPSAVLIATSLGDLPLATIVVPGSAAAGSYAVGDAVPGVGTLDRIGWIDCAVHDGDGRRGRLSLLDPAAASRGGAATPAAAAAPNVDPYADRIRKIDDHSFEVERSLVRELVSGAAKAGSARVVPVPDGDKLAGLKFYGVQTGSLAAALGVKNADVVSAINNVHIDGAQTVLDMFAQLDSLDVVELTGTRGAKPLLITLRLK
jgi:hypothetical protein